jgi:two-component system, NtrC family, sensor histidine kinase GlrK
MRLASKIFLTSALVIAVLAAVGMLSLGAIGRLVSVNREITTQAVPAMRLATAARDAMSVLARMEARLVVMRDAQYAKVWNERAAALDDDLRRLGDMVKTDREREALAAATEGFNQYRAIVEREQAGMAQLGPRTPESLEPPGEAVAEGVEGHLEKLMEAMHARMVAAQAEALRLETRTWTGVVAATATALALALVGTGFVAFRVTRSLRMLSAATRAVAAGSLREPIPVGGRDEIGELARSFEAMAAQLRQMDEMKDEFFAKMSHELRSPLTSVREASQLLRDEVPGPLNAKQTRLVEIIGRSSDRLLRLVNQILEMSRLRAGVLPLHRARLDLDRIIARALEEMRPQADEAGVGLERERVGSRFTCVGDEDRLVQVIINLVANAIRFTARGGRVVVRLVDAGNEIELAVEDTGSGIPERDLPHIFDSYRQAHAGRGGTGLGLAIVRGVVEAHGGRVTVESQEGKGSRFTVLLPRRLPEAA